MLNPPGLSGEPIVCQLFAVWMSAHGDVHQELDGSDMVPDRPVQMI